MAKKRSNKEQTQEKIMSTEDQKEVTGTEGTEGAETPVQETPTQETPVVETPVATEGTEGTDEQSAGADTEGTEQPAATAEETTAPVAAEAPEVATETAAQVEQPTEEVAPVVEEPEVIIPFHPTLNGQMVEALKVVTSDGLQQSEKIADARRAIYVILMRAMAVAPDQAAFAGIMNGLYKKIMATPSMRDPRRAFVGFMNIKGLTDAQRMEYEVLWKFLIDTADETTRRTNLAAIPWGNIENALSSPGADKIRESLARFFNK